MAGNYVCVATFDGENATIYMYTTDDAGRDRIMCELGVPDGSAEIPVELVAAITMQFTDEIGPMMKDWKDVA